MFLCSFQSFALVITYVTVNQATLDKIVRGCLMSVSPNLVRMMEHVLTSSMGTAATVLNGFTVRDIHLALLTSTSECMTLIWTFAGSRL